jgi:hypothetical protein
MMQPYLTELLGNLTEELGESQVVVGKILRHGLSSSDPTGQILGDNRSLLVLELGDVLAIISLLNEFAITNSRALEAARIDKLKRLKRWVHDPAILCAIDALLSDVV